MIDDLNVFNLPFLFRNTAHMQKVDRRTIGQELLDKVTNNDKAGLVGLCWMDAGARSVYDTKKPIKTIADLKGLKIRVIGNPMFVDMMNALGGNGVAMGYDQVFSALADRRRRRRREQSAELRLRQSLSGREILHAHRAPDRAGDAGVLAQDLGHAVARTTRR